MKKLRWPLTMTPMAWTHKIGLVMRWELECAIVNKKFILLDFKCNSTINIDFGILLHFLVFLSLYSKFRPIDEFVSDMQCQC